jgi:hypothetical protein
MKNLKYGIAFIVLSGVLISTSGCSSYQTFQGSRFNHGSTLSSKIRGKKLSIAVLPVVDWSGQDKGREKKSVGMSNAEVHITNSLMRKLWQKNQVRLIDKNTLLAELRKARLSRSAVFPAHQEGTCGEFPMYGPCPLTLRSKVLPRNMPNCTELRAVGVSLRVDLLYIGRITRNVKVSEKNWDIIMDLMVMDVSSGKIFAHGSHGVRVPAKLSSADIVTNILLEYSPLPDKEFLKTRANRALVSGLTTGILQELVGVNIKVSSKMTHSDETWRMYPKGYFVRKYQMNRGDIASIYRS